MMRIQTTIALAGLVAGAAYFAPQAEAQSTGVIPVRVKVGVFKPQADNVAGNTNLAAEVDVALPKTGDGKTFVSMGYTSGGKNGDYIKVVPITVGRYFSPPNPAEGATGNLYAGVGAGPYLVRAKRDGDAINRVALGGYGVVGYQFPNKYFLEAKYSVATKVNGAQPGGLALSIGKSF